MVCNSVLIKKVGNASVALQDLVSEGAQHLPTPKGEEGEHGKEGEKKK